MLDVFSAPNPAAVPNHKPLARDCTIGEASRLSGVSSKMIRHYESIGLIRPAARSAANYRVYDPAIVRTLRFIARARGLGFGLDEIGRLIALWEAPARSSAEVKAIALHHLADIEARIAALQGMKQAISALATQCAGDQGPDCAILDKLSGLRPKAASAAKNRQA